jgi:hypothetical protein
MTSIIKLKQQIHKKTSMPVSKGQLLVFLKEYSHVRSDTLKIKCETIMDNRNFNNFTDFMVKRTDIPLFK